IEVGDNIALNLLRAIARVFLSQALLGVLHVLGNPADDFLGVLVGLGDRLVFLFFLVRLGFFFRWFGLLFFVGIVGGLYFFLQSDGGLWLIARAGAVRRLSRLRQIIIQGESEVWKSKIGNSKRRIRTGST